jgi:ABC-type dipeptide/oligopeptide/nickel transport system ATPase subunit
MGIYKADSFSMKLSGLKLNEKTSQNIWAGKIWGTRAGMFFQHADESHNLQATVKETFDGLLEKRLNNALLKTKLQNSSKAPFTMSFLERRLPISVADRNRDSISLRTLVPAPHLIILDEPLNGLDFKSFRKVLDLLEEKCAAGSALLMISHNEEIFEHFVTEECI